MITLKKIVLGVMLVLAFGEARGGDVSSIVKEELDREFATLNKLDPSVYYLAYRIDETKSWTIGGAFGNLISSDKTDTRYLTTVLRVGDRQFDNTHVFKGDEAGMSFSATALPLANKADAIKQEIWLQTDRAYKQAKADYLAKKNQIKLDDTHGVADFSNEAPEQFLTPPLEVKFDEADFDKWQEISRRCSKLFLKDEGIKEGNFSFEYNVTRKIFISSEGTHVEQNSPYVRIMISGLIQSDEGNEMPLAKSFYAESPDKLPSTVELMKETSELVDKLIDLKEATLAEPYTGPAILSSEAAGVFFHEIFGHRVEGHRMKDENDGQTFKTRLGDKVLPKTLNVVFDPTQKYFHEQYLIGYYKFDDQGVAAQKVDVINKGVLKDFLYSRTPIEGTEHSNGHGRASVGSSAVSRQSNMFVSSNKPLTNEALRKMLIKECKKQKLAYGYFFKEVTGGFTTTGRYMPNAFNVFPTEVYRVYVDGREDELVRGVDLIGTPLSMFSNIKAAGDVQDVFTGFCGAESGWVPVTTVAPAIFVEKIETQRKAQLFSKGTILPAPTLNQK